MMLFELIVAQIKYIATYECAACGKTQSGTTVNTEFRGDSSSHLKRYLDSQQQRSHDMPVGWSFDGEFNCGCRRNKGGKR